MSEIPSILKKILQTKLEEVAERSSRLPLEEARAMAFDQAETRGFANSVETFAANGQAVIAEVKKASPSA